MGYHTRTEAIGLILGFFWYICGQKFYMSKCQNVKK